MPRVVPFLVIGGVVAVVATVLVLVLVGGPVVQDRLAKHRAAAGHEPDAAGPEGEPPEAAR